MFLLFALKYEVANDTKEVKFGIKLVCAFNRTTNLYYSVWTSTLIPATSLNVNPYIYSYVHKLILFLFVRLYIAPKCIFLKLRQWIKGTASKKLSKVKH